MDCTNGQEVVRIKKYPNRRYYDTARSRHITLSEIHELIQQGHDVAITDSRAGTDITNTVLFQILLEKCPPKVDLFPASILHWMIRTDRSGMQESFDRFLAPFTGMMSASRKQVEDFWRGAIGGAAPNPMANPMTNPIGSPMVDPMAWASSMAQAMQPGPQPTSQPQDSHVAGNVAGNVGDGGETSPDDEMPPEEAMPKGPSAPDAGIEELRQQIRDLTQRIDHVQGQDDADRT